MRPAKDYMPTPQQKPEADELSRIIADADRSMCDLDGARRESSAVYMERFRKLRNLKSTLHSVRGTVPPTAEQLAEIVTPELRRLLDDPLHNL